MTDVHQAVPMGNEELDTLTDKLARGILEHMARLIVREQDGPRLSDDERRARYLREKAFQTPG